MLKRIIDKATYDALSDEMKKIYVVDGDNYKLNVEVSADDDPAELKRAKAREVETRKQETERANKLEAEVTRLKQANGDVATLEASWKEKLATAEKTSQTAVGKLTGFIEKSLLDAKANEIAAKISTNPELMFPHVRGRLKADLEGTTPLIRVVDGAGNLSASSLEELQKEFVANPTFKTIIIASLATGGGAAGGAGSSGNGGASPGNKKFNELTETERIELHKNNPAEFNRLASEHKASNRKF